jgi:tetratricopeptide (TPR) repeat protein
MAGNALMRLRRYQDAVTVYGHALRDETYDKRGAVQANLGAAYGAIGEYAEAVKAYEAALAEPDYTTQYRALQGMAGALCERGRVDEAAVAYRKAAIDPDNPNPGKALVNLGLCFMALNRPADAVEAFKAALGFDDYQGRGKALANLGQAYVALGEYQEAVRAFERSTQLHSHTLSPAALEAYEAALAAAPPATGRETVDGWETGQMPPAMAAAEPAGWDTADLQALTGGAALGAASPAPYSPAPADPQPASEPSEPDGAAAAAALGMGDEAAVSEFFTMTEDEMRSRDQEARRAQRAQRRAGGGWVRSAVAVALVVLVLVAGCGSAYWFGYGWPTQVSTVNGLVGAYASGQPVERFWVAVPGKDVAREMAKMPPVKEFEVEGVDRGRLASTVRVTVTPEKGAPLHYAITLAREGVGWKVTGVENDWGSTGG